MKKVIFLVDDDKEDQEVLEMLFKDISPETTTFFFETGEALEDHLTRLNKDCYPDLIILDYNMPGWSGGETLRRIKANPFTAKIPIVVYATGLMQSAKNEIKKDGSLMYLTKGRSLVEITEHVRFFTELIADIE